MRIGVLAASLCFAIIVLNFPAFAQSCAPGQWKQVPVASEFRGKKARVQLSGAACNRDNSQCLVVNDETEFAQLFSISGGRIVPGRKIELTPEDDEPDAEAAIFKDGSFYVVGSHGRSRSKDRPNDASYIVMRVDPASGVTARSTRWRDAIFASDLRDYAGQQLTGGGPDGNGGVNVEGAAVWGDRMYLGLRGPSIGTRAHLLHAPLRDVFDQAGPALSAITEPVELGPRTGIRDLTAVKSGLLILSGPVTDEQVVPAVFFWNPADKTTRKLVELPGLSAGWKAETLVALDPDETGDPHNHRVMLIFEGPANGNPVECLIPKAR